MKSLFAQAHPIPDVFVGREEVINKLTKWLSSDCSTLVLYAIGGMGKSTLARVWSEQVAQWQQASGEDEQGRPPVFWWSFYEQDAGFRKFLSRLAEWLQDWEPEKEVLPVLNLEKIFERLKERSYLLVLDGFERELRAFAPVAQLDRETRSNDCTDPLAAEFLRLLSSEHMPSHVLLTSRVVPVELGSTSDHVMLHALEGLSDHAVVEFFQAKRINGSDHRLIAVSARFGHHPLALQLLAGRINAAGLSGIEAARDWDVMPMLRSRTTHILYHATRDLPVDEASLLRLLCASPDNLHYPLVERAAQHYSNLSLTLQKLEQRGLVSISSNLIAIHPIVRIYVVQELHVGSDDHSHIAEAILNEDTIMDVAVRDCNVALRLTYHLSRARKYGAALTALKYCVNSKYYFDADYGSVMDATDGFFNGIDSEGALGKAFKIVDQTYLLSIRANCFEKLGNYKEAELIQIKTLALDRKGGNSGNIGITSLNLSRTLMWRGKLREAHKVLASIPVESLRNPQVAARFRLFGGLLRAVLGNRKGLRMAEAAARFFLFQYTDSPEPGTAQGLAVSLAYFAEISSELGLNDQALALAQKACEIADDCGARREIARSMVAVVTCMSRANPKQDQLLNLVDEALLVTRTTQQHEFEVQALITKASVLQSIGETRQGMRVAMEALRRSIQTELSLKKTESHLQLAQLHLQLGRRDDAEFHLGKATDQLEADPDFAALRLVKLAKKVANALQNASAEV